MTNIKFFFSSFNYILYCIHIYIDKFLEGDDNKYFNKIVENFF